VSYSSRLGVSTVLWRLEAADFATTADQPLIRLLPSAQFLIQSILVTNASVALNGALGGVYTGPSKSGSALVAASQGYGAVTLPTSVLNMTLTAAGTRMQTTDTLYFSLTTPLGTPATADIYVIGIAG
jgi:hypothetical protein